MKKLMLTLSLVLALAFTFGAHAALADEDSTDGRRMMCDVTRDVRDRANRLPSVGRPIGAAIEKGRREILDCPDSRRGAGKAD